MALKKLYLVKDLSRLTGFSTNTVKYYLWEGLLKECGKTPYTNFRIFDVKAVRQLRAIRAMRKQRMSIDDIRKALKHTRRRA